MRSIRVVSIVVPVVGAFAALVAGAPRALAGDPPPASSCTTHCHGLEKTQFAQSAHVRSLDCTSCHGGDPTAERDKDKSHSVEKGFSGKLAREKILSLCGDCHADTAKMAQYGLPTDQLALYRTSSHGKALAKGDAAVAVCTDCHGAHEILSARDPRAKTAGVHQPETCGRCHADSARMAPHGIASDVVERFRSSVHGKALLEDRTRGAPSCSDCHGSHGAAPPRVGDVAQVCGQCHLETEDQFHKSAHGRAGEKMNCRTCHEKDKGAAFRRGGCGACHDPHAMDKPSPKMLAGKEPGHCDHCHNQPEPAVEAFRAALTDGTARLVARMDDARKLIEGAKESSLFLEGEESYIRESERVLVKVLPVAHSLDRAEIESRLRDGVQRQERTIETIEKKMHALRDRKIVISALVLLLLLLGALFAVKLDEARRLS